MLLIQNGRVLDPYTQMDALCDVLIGDDGVIAQVAEHIDAPAGCTVYTVGTVKQVHLDGDVRGRGPRLLREPVVGEQRRIRLGSRPGGSRDRFQGNGFDVAARASHG